MPPENVPDINPSNTKSTIQEAFQESEEKFRILAETTTAAIMIYQKDRWVYANTAAERISGYSRDELLSMNFWEVVHPEFQDQVRTLGYARMQNADTPPVHAEIKILHKDRSERWLDVTSGTIQFHSKRAGILTAIDITARKSAEEHLVESERKYRAIFDSLDDLYYQTDMAGIITTLSPSCKKLTGFSPEDLSGTQVLDLYPFPEQRASLLGKLESEGEVYDYEIILLDKKGRHLTVSVNCHIVKDSHGTPVAIEGTLRDMTPRKEMEKALEENEEMFRAVFNNANDAIFVHEVLAENIPGRYIRVNDMACHILRYTREELLARTPQDIVSSEHRARMPEIGRKIQKNGHYRFEGTHRRKDGTEFPVEISTHLFRFRGKILALSISRDITERKRNEQDRIDFTNKLETTVKERTGELEDANVLLEEEIQIRKEAEKKIQAALDEKEVLLREIHHRVKNNLQIIVSLLSLQSRYIQDEKTINALKESQNRVRAMAIIHEKLYKSDDLASIDMGGYANMLVRDLFQYYRVTAGKVRLNVDIHNMCVSLNTAIPVGLIINELVTNSLKYAFPEGRPGEITISAENGSDGITLIFRDNGVGIPDTVNWLEPKSLGLRLIHTLVDQMSGTISLDKSSGTTFTIKIPETCNHSNGPPRQE